MEELFWENHHATLNKSVKKNNVILQGAIFQWLIVESHWPDFEKLESDWSYSCNLQLLTVLRISRIMKEIIIIIHMGLYIVVYLL